MRAAVRALEGSSHGNDGTTALGDRILAIAVESRMVRCVLRERSVLDRALPR